MWQHYMFYEYRVVFTVSNFCKRLNGIYSMLTFFDKKEIVCENCIHFMMKFILIHNKNSFYNIN